jgi:cyclophilin family peptidyl-prolyl cis-trans isomerase
MLRLRVLFFILMLSGIARAELSNGLYANFDTSMGSFTCRLDYVEAPLTCANFVGLAEGSQAWIDPTSGAVRNDPFYTNLIFHRVIAGFMIQGGDPLGTGASGPGYTFPDEFVPSSVHYAAAGTLVMANSGPDSNGSQFFVTVVPYPNLDPSKYMVFGDVVDGIGAVTNIGSVAVTNDRPLVDVVINQVQILRIGTDAEGFDVAAQPLPEVTSMDLSLTKAAEGLQVKAGIMNHLEVSIYSSTNLTDWSLAERKYWSTATNDWSLAVAAENNQGFYRGAQVFYPQANSNLPVSVEGHVFDLSLSGGDLELTLQPGGVGSYIYNGSPGTISHWDWLATPYYDLYVETSGLAPLRFSFSYTSSTNGTCRGHYYSSGWNPLNGIFTDAPAP